MNPSTSTALALSFGWMAVTGVLGAGVLAYASRHLETVVDELERDFSRSFWWGVAGQIGFVPVVALVSLALALTILGAIVIPLAAVGLVLAAAGMATLGFLATAQLTGAAFVPARRRDALSARAAGTRSLLFGVVFYLGLWVVAAAFVERPVLGAVARGVAFAATWVAATAGYGAALRTRGGTRAARRTVSAGPPPDEFSWATPTPIAGVAAARRPTVTPSYTETP